MSSWDISPWQIYAQRILHSAACSASGVGHILHQAGMTCGRPGAPFAAISSGSEEPKKRKKKKRQAPAPADEQEDERPAPEAKAEGKVMARDRLRRRSGLGYILRKLQKKRVRVNGKRTNLLKLAQQVVRNRQIKEVAGDEPQIRDMTHRELIEAMPGQELRPGAFKMQLRAGEEAALPLDLLARGMTFSPSPRFGSLFGGRRDLTFGIYGRADAARKLLQEKWSGLPLEYVIGDSEFFEDVLDNAGELELTVMALPVRPLPLAALRENLIQRLTPRLGETSKMHSLKGTEEEGSAETADLPEKAASSVDWQQLQSLASTFSDERLRGSKVCDREGNLKPDTHFIFSALPDSSLVAEVITPGNLRDRVTYSVGPWQSKALTRAVFGMFLGEAPIDAQARAHAGQTLVYLTNGFKLTPDPSNPSQAFGGDHGTPIFTEPETQLVAPSPSIFSLEGKGKSVRLLNNVERRRAWLAS